jgi:putative membrane protein
MSRLSLMLKGGAMGVAEVIPGVSGGTIAFITGIYERLLNAVKAFGPKLVGISRREGLAGVWRAVDGGFLLVLLSGMAIGLLIGVFGVSWLLDHYPPLIWGFFFGLILASILYMGRRIGRWGGGEISLFIVGAAIAYTITVLTPASGSEALWFVFLCGVIAISAFILPGISGSFMLLLLGMYQFIIQDTLKGLLVGFSMEKLITLTVFALGCLVGLMTMSRLLSWTFNRYRSLTLAILTGFLVGSLNKIYPWRNAQDWLRDGTGQVVMAADGFTPKKILEEINVLPSGYEGDPLVLGVFLACLLGFLIVFAFDRFGPQTD